VENYSSITLKGFSLEVLGAAAPAEDWPVVKTVQRAVRRYLGDRVLRPPGWACLPLPEQDFGRGDSALEIDLDEATAKAIEAEAEAQGVSLEAVVAHAVMYLWASERQPVAPVPGGQEDAAGAQAARRGATTGVAPSFASDPRRLSRPR
jgi:hypothetical protein